jgi:hypothetical protein
MRRWQFATLAISLFGFSAGTSHAESQAFALATPAEPHAKGSLDWIYSCPNSKPCTFSCPGAVAATHVIKLTIHLRRLQIGNKDALALFYDYSTMQFPTGSGFTINTGIGTSSCQVNGMNLDYFGPPKSELQN